MTDGLTGRPAGSSMTRADWLKSAGMVAAYGAAKYGAYRAAPLVRQFFNQAVAAGADVAEFAAANPELVVPLL